MKAKNKLIIAISSRALFDLEESHNIYINQGVKTYCQYQIAHENDPLKPGVAFSLVKKLLALNNDETQQEHVEVILLSKNSADTGLRIFNSIEHHQLTITRAAFAGESIRGQRFGLFGGRSLGMVTATADPSQWLKKFGVDVIHIDQYLIVVKGEKIEESRVRKHMDWLVSRAGTVETNK